MSKAKINLGRVLSPKANTLLEKLADENGDLDPLEMAYIDAKSELEYELDLQQDQLNTVKEARNFVEKSMANIIKQRKLIKDQCIKLASAIDDMDKPAKKIRKKKNTAKKVVPSEIVDILERRNFV